MKRILALLYISTSLTCYSQNWIQLGNSPIQKHHPISFSINGKGYAVTGALDDGTPTKDVYEYNPVNDSWTSLSDFPGDPRSFAIGVVNNAKAYLGFGASSTDLLDDFWSFDPSTNTWTQLANCGCSGRRHPAMITIGDKIYVGLGDDSLGDRKDWWVYNITNNTWAQIADLPGDERHHPFMFNAGGRVFAGLGHSGNTIYQDWYELDTMSNTWTPKAPFPGEARVAGTQFSNNGVGYVLSGDGDNHSYMDDGEFWGYNPNFDVWTQLTSHPGESRWAPGSFVINDEVYFFGGYNRFTGEYPQDVWKYSLIDSPASIDDNAELSVKIFPNPTTSEINWSSIYNIDEIIITDIVGKKVFTGNVNQDKMNVNQLANGNYLIVLKQNSKIITIEKITISK